MWFALLLWGCASPESVAEGDDTWGLLGPVYGENLEGQGRMNPFPSAHLVGEDGHLDLPAESVPWTPTPMPLDGLRWRTGFSPGQVSTLRLPGIRDTGLPSWTAPTPGEGSVRLADLTTGSWLPVMAELDAWEDAVDPTLLVRPLQAMSAGHRVAVVVTTEALDRPERFDGLISGDPPADLVGWTDHYQGLMADLVTLGMDEDNVALAWDFPVDSGVRPLQSAIEQLSVPTAWEWTSEKNADEGDNVHSRTFRYAEGWFENTRFLNEEETALDVDPATGEVFVTGTDIVKMYVHVPESVAHAHEGSVPVVLYGHGISGRPDFDLDGGSAATRLSEELGAILVAVAWRGLDYDGRATTIQGVSDFGTFPTLPDQMVQGQVDMRALAELVHQTDFAIDPVFQGRDGQDLIDPTQLFFYGVSMGSIEGMVFAAQAPPIQSAVFHVGGAAWSTTMERSDNWSIFEHFIVINMPEPHLRQQTYALSQLWWDRVDPIAHTDGLADMPMLLQENVGDDAVTNLGTEMLARSIDLPVLTPDVNGPWGLSTVASGQPPGSRALVQLDPLRGLPPDENRPAPETGAHDVTIGWPGVRAQTVDFLTPELAGQVNHYCGASACTDENRGSDSL